MPQERIELTSLMLQINAFTIKQLKQTTFTITLILFRYRKLREMKYDLKKIRKG